MSRWRPLQFEDLFTRDDAGCWPWVGRTDRDGFGRFYDRDCGKVVGAHRYSFEQFRGGIPDELCVLHSCDNRKCVNPWHLFLGPKPEIAHNRHRKGRDARGDKNGARLHPERRPRGDSHFSKTQPQLCPRGLRNGMLKHPPKLTPDKAIEIARSKGSSSVIAARFGVSPSMVRLIRAGLSWGAVTGVHPAREQGAAV